jgi:hypothetical protein
MIDTYMDRCDAASGYLSTTRFIEEDPRYYNGQLYATVIDRNVAEARSKLQLALIQTHAAHAYEMAVRIPLGHRRSLFTHEGLRKFQQPELKGKP